jgi:MoxR-like ATPase
MTLPEATVQREIVLGHAGDHLPGNDLPPLAAPGDLLAMQQAADAVPVSETVAAYLVDLCEALRRLAGADHAVSVRASLAVMQAARARACLEQAAAVHPDHVQALFPSVMRHRVITDDGSDPRVLIDTALEQTAVP